MTTSVIEARKSATPRAGVADRLARRLVLRRLAGLRQGTLELREGQERLRYGSAAANPLNARIRVLRPRFYRAIACGGSLGAAESYVDGDWDSDDLTSLVRLMARNRDTMLEVDGGLARIGELVARAVHLTRANTRHGSRRNILAHYDLGNELFEHFLDWTMTYSSAFFTDPGMSLEAAQTAKLDRLCRKLRLTPADHLLEIGTGWGSLAIHAASHYGCRVTTTTISPAQLEVATRRVAAAGLSDRVELLQKDYRELDGRYDKLISIEMIEAVGHEHLPTFFATCSRLLEPDGLMGLQAITIADRNYQAARRSVDFIQRYIFPGGALPSVAALTGAIATASDLTPHHLDEMGLHYAETLRRWRRRFEEQWPAIAPLGFDERFRRLWRYYFAYCEGGFLERVIGVVQMVLAGPAFRGESVRCP